MAHIRHLNAHDRPPEPVRRLYKKYTKLPISDVELDSKVVRLGTINPDWPPDGVSVAGYVSGRDLRLAFNGFLNGGGDASADESEGDIPVFAHEAVSGQFFNELGFR